MFGEPPVGTGSGNRWNKYATSRSCFFNGKLVEVRPCPVVKLEDYERTISPRLLPSYAAGGFCWVITGSTQFGRAYADPDEVPDALDYYAALRERGREVFYVSPYGERGRVPFSFDYSFNSYPLAYERPGPEIVIYRLDGGDCGDVVPGPANCSIEGVRFDRVRSSVGVIRAHTITSDSCSAK